MSKPKTIRASAAETITRSLGAAQASIAGGMKNRLLGQISKGATRDDSAIIRNSAKAGVASSAGQALAQAVDPVQRAAIVSGAVNAKAQTGASANATARGSMIDRMSDAIGLGFGSQEASANSISTIARGQNNAAFTVADAKMRNTGATMNAIGGAINTYGAAKSDMDATNAINAERAKNKGMSYYDQQNSVFSKKLSHVPIPDKFWG